ncbi:MAG TPA: 2'-5' RNA ligase family protein [Candidatus Limnocylindria bacterium]
MDFPTGNTWPAWQRDYRFGALVIEPPRWLAALLDPIRLRLDPESAAAFGAHITLTPPFATAPNSADEERAAAVIRGVAAMRLQLGRPTRFSGSPVVYLPVVPRHGFVKLRAMLLATGLFRLDLPHTDDFVPHLTLSEFGTAPDAALKADVPPPEAMTFLVETVAWIVPDEAVRFSVRRTFPLDSGGDRLKPGDP